MVDRARSSIRILRAATAWNAARLPREDLDVEAKTSAIEAVIRCQLLIIECVKDLDLQLMSNDKDAALDHDQYRKLTMARSDLEKALDELEEE